MKWGLFNPTLGIKNQNQGMVDILDRDPTVPVYYLGKPPSIINSMLILGEIPTVPIYYLGKPPSV